MFYMTVTIRTQNTSVCNQSGQESVWSQDGMCAVYLTLSLEIDTHLKCCKDGGEKYVQKFGGKTL